MMNKNSCRILFCLGFFFLSLFSGCGKSDRPDDLPPLNPCKLTIVQEGKGLADAFVSMYSTDPTFKWVVAGNTDAQGVVQPTTHSRFPGVPVGDYKIVVSKIERSDQGNRSLVPDGEQSSGQKSVEIFQLVEKKFSDVSTTPLTLSIQKGSNAQTFDVGKPVREKNNISVM